MPFGFDRLHALHNKDEYARTTVSKIRGIMSRIYEVGMIHKKVAKNPVEGLATSTKSNYRAIKITPAQTLSILRSMIQNILHFTLVFLVAATALRSSEVLALRWADILWEERKIRIVKSRKKDGGGRKHQDAVFGTRRTDGRCLSPLLARMAQANAIRQAQGLRFPVSSEEGQDSNLLIGILPRSPKTSGEEGWGCDPRRTSLGSP
jgi:integrase